MFSTSVISNILLRCFQRKKNKQNKNRNKTLEMCYILMSEIVNWIIINSAQRKKLQQPVKRTENSFDYLSWPTGALTGLFLLDADIKQELFLLFDL